MMSKLRERLDSLIDLAVNNRDALMQIAGGFVGGLSAAWLVYSTLLGPAKESTVSSLREKHEVLESENRSLETHFSIYENRLKLCHERADFFLDQLQSCRDELSAVARALKSRLSNGIKRQQFSVKPAKEDEIVLGEPGAYYTVDISTGGRRKTIRFPEGRYWIEDFADSFEDSLTTFFIEVVEPLGPNVRHRIYIRGSADIKGDLSWERDLNPNYNFLEIEYYPTAFDSQTQFIPVPTVAEVREPFRNADLPNLRGRPLVRHDVALYKCSCPLIYPA